MKMNDSTISLEFPEDCSHDLACCQNAEDAIPCCKHTHAFCYPFKEHFSD